MTRFLWIRHAHHGFLGKALAGRSDAVGLDARGIAEARGLPERLASYQLAAIYTSPQRRARETAAPLAAALGCEPSVDQALDEIDFGEWTGKSFAALASDPGWKIWCERRSMAQPPGGERLVDAQRRAVAAMESLLAKHAGESIALFSHGDVIKAVLAHVLRLSLDDLERFDVAPASISIVSAEAAWARVDLLNDAGISAR